MKRILITGATGFIGRNLIERIGRIKAEYMILAFVDKNDRGGIEFLRQKNINILSMDDLDHYSEDIDCCIHLASYGVAYGARDIELMIDVNIKLTAKIANFCSKHNCSLFINTGSCFEYGSGIQSPIKESHALAPEDIYAASKVACEVFLSTLAKTINLRFVTIRPFAVFGKYEPKHRIMPIVFSAGINKEPIDLTGGEQLRDYMAVVDVADSILGIIQNQEKVICGEAINICSGLAISLKEFILLIAKTCGFSANLYRFGKIPYRNNESMYFVGNNERLMEIIGHKDFDLSDSKILEAFDFFCKQ